jgi:hypothetical protein
VIIAGGTSGGWVFLLVDFHPLNPLFEDTPRNARPAMTVSSENGQRPEPALNDRMRKNTDDNTSQPGLSPNFPYPQEISKEFKRLGPDSSYVR